MIGPLEPDVPVGLHGGDHIHVSLVEEHFFEPVGCTADVAKVHEYDLVALADRVDRLHDILPHLCNATLAEQHAAGVARDQIENPLEILDTHHDAGGPAKRLRNRRVIGMESDAHADIFCNRDDALQKVIEILPQPIL